MTSPGPPRNQDLLLPYALPYLLYLGLAALPLTREASYGLRIAVCAAALAFFWRRYLPLLGPCSPAGSVAAGLLAGLLGMGVWVALLLPFAPEAADAWEPPSFALRLLASAAVVPLLEELLMRGYLLRLLVQWDEGRRAGEPAPLARALSEHSVAEITPGAWTLLAVAGSTLVFTAGHAPAEWLAAAGYGVLMAALWIVRKDLLSCVVAHGATNVALALTVWSTGRWELW